MGKKLIALASSDWHLHDWQSFNEESIRTQVTVDFMVYLFDLADSYKVPILFEGDLFHTPKGLSNKVLSIISKVFNYIKKTSKSQLIGISGNHEKDQGISLFETICRIYPENFKCIDHEKSGISMANGITICGISHTRRNEGLVDRIKEMAKIKGPKILLLHTELYGAPDPSGYDLEPQNIPRNLKSLFKDFNLVLAGHVHAYTQVCDNVYMVGAPNQQRKSDSGCKMGYLEIYDDFSVVFKQYSTPEFKYYKEEDGHKETDDYWVQIPKPKKLKKTSEAEFKPTMGRHDMAEQYAEEKGIKSKRKVKALIDILNRADD